METPCVGAKEGGDLGNVQQPATTGKVNPRDLIESTGRAHLDQTLTYSRSVLDKGMTADILCAPK